MSNNNNIVDLIRNRKRRQSPFLAKRKWHNLNRVLSAAVSQETYVPFNPMGRNMIEKLSNGKVDPKKVLNNNIPIEAEAIITWKMVQFGVKYYGEPEFTYDINVDDERSENVDFWRNLIKFGREVGTDVAKDRIVKLESLNKPDRGIYVKRQNLTAKAVDLVAKQYVGVIKSTDFTNRQSEFSITSSTTNAGEWTYARKIRKVDGQDVRDIIKRDAKSLAHDITQFGDLPAFLGARSQRGKWGIISKSGEEVKAEDWLKANFKLSKEEFVTKFLEEVRYTNTKKRIIAACPSSWSYHYSALGFAFIEGEKRRTAPSQVHLEGPLNIRKALMDSKRIAQKLWKEKGIKVTRYNADADSYDTTLIDQHADDYYQLAQKLLPLESDKFLEKVAVADALTRPILYLKEPLSDKVKISVIKSKLKTILAKNSLRSGEPVTNHFGSSNNEIQTLKSRIATNPKWLEVYDYFVMHNVNPILCNGDDNSVFYIYNEKDSIEDDLTNHTNDMEQKNGLIFQDPTKKGESHYFYNQLRLTYDNRFISPLTRIRLYHKETSKEERPAYTQVVDKLMNYEFRYECKGIAEWIHTFELPFDDTRMGTIDRDTGREISFSEFKQKLKLEAQGNSKNAKSLSELLFRGNPYDNRIVSKDGNIEWGWLEIQWNKMRDIVNGKIA